MRGDDHEEDVRDHDRSEHRADLDVRGAPGEELPRAPGRQRHERDNRERGRLVLLGEQRDHVAGRAERVLALREHLDEPRARAEELGELLDAQLPR